MIKYSHGSLPAFELLYQRHKGASYRYFLRQCRSRHEAEDLLQELWGRVIKAKDNYQQTALFTTWFYRIAHNLLVDHHKHLSLVTDNCVARQNEPEQQEPADLQPGSSPEFNLMQKKQALLLKHCLKKLPAVQLEAFIIKEEYGLKIADIAQIVDASTEATKSRLRYAISSLKRCIGGLS